MNVEQKSLRDRAARHAALGEPSRLALVDLLALGDLSPSELRARTGMASNLLAHHLKQLESAGIVRRSRSEGDARRSYVRLVPEALDGLGVHGVGAARRVVFVCRANSARSQLAAAIWERASGIPVASAGTHPAERIDPGAVAAAERHGLGFAAARPRHLDEVLDADDYVITVCDDAHEETSGLAALHWSVPDPVRIGTGAAFDAALDEIARRVDGLAPRLTAA